MNSSAKLITDPYGPTKSGWVGGDQQVLLMVNVIALLPRWKLTKWILFKNAFKSNIDFFTGYLF
jgi:hypothetical protein